MTEHLPLRPCGTCRRPVPDGVCPDHPRDRGGYRPDRPDVPARRRTARLFRAILATQPHCAYCLATRATTVDHVHPLSRRDVEPDPGLPPYLPACRTCNTSKGDRTLIEWVASGLAPTGARDIVEGRTTWTQ